MRDIVTEIEDLGAQLVVVGSGSPAHARAFIEEEGLSFALYVDPELEAYRAAGMGRGIAPGTFTASLRALRKGFRQSATRGNPMQNGGVFVLAPDGQVLYRQISRYSGDHAEPMDILSALRLASVPGSQHAGDPNRG